MHCSSYCTGEIYNLLSISEFLTKLGWSHKIYGKDVLHVEAHTSAIEQLGDIFIFAYGCMVFWWPDSIINELNEEKILERFKQFLTNPLHEHIVDRCNYRIDTQEITYVDEEHDEIVIERDDPTIKLSFSYGLSQSVKLIMFENSVERTIEDNKKFPDELIKTGKISLSGKALSKKIGVLFAERNFINLNNDILDTPDFFWRRPKYEPYYEMSVKFLDIRQRMALLNTRLDIIHELYGILSNKLQYIHTSRLELIIICLIMIEVVLSFLKFPF